MHYGYLLAWNLRRYAWLEGFHGKADSPCCLLRPTPPNLWTDGLCATLMIHGQMVLISTCILTYGALKTLPHLLHPGNTGKLPYQLFPPLIDTFNITMFISWCGYLNGDNFRTAESMFWSMKWGCSCLANFIGTITKTNEKIIVQPSKFYREINDKYKMI